MQNRKILPNPKLPTPPVSFLTGLASLITAQAVRAHMCTLDYRILLHDPATDPAAGVGGPYIYVVWHENILFPLYFRSHCYSAALLSQHKDADILAKVANMFGYIAVRGSSNRGASQALRDLTQQGNNSANLVITPDGPRGPRRKLAQGAIFLASKLQIPIVPIGCGYNKPWRAKSWDRFAIPKPFSRARAVLGPKITIPEKLKRKELESYRLRVESLLNNLTNEAEAWATCGTRRMGEIPTHQSPAPLKSHRPQIETKNENPPRSEPHKKPTLKIVA